ncbi:MAG: phosphatidate cytidylyltransferase, partial [Acidimicrobiia bacterium]|nr:phosphatidate cytidylyltransferase [Acidimicrobiia bacterium]
EAAAREAEEAAEAAAREAEEAAEAAAREAEEAADVEDEVVLRAVADPTADEDREQAGISSIEEVAVEDLQAEPEWLEAVEEMTLDDIAEAGEIREKDAIVAVVPAEGDEDSVDEPEMPTAVIDAIATVDGDAVPDDAVALIMEDATFEVVDLDAADLRADSAEHMFEVLDYEDEHGDAAIAHDEITAEVPVTAAPAAVEDPLAAPEFHVPEEYELVATNVDETRDALAAFMAPPAPADLVDDEAGDMFDDHEEAIEEPSAAGEFVEEPPLVAGQLQIPAAVAEPISMEDDIGAEPEREPEPEAGPLTPEQELIARLSGDLTLPDFETFVQEDFARGFMPEPTQEHIGLAEEVSSAKPPVQSPLAATMPGVDHGHVGFHDLDDDLHFDDPDAPDEEPSEEIVAGAETYGSDLTLRVASAVILVALLTGTLWAGGVTFLIFITVIAVAAQIEFYAALRAGGYRPLVLFGLLGGLGALIGTYVQGSDVLRQGPTAIAAALGLTIVATFAWYGARETPPRHPWRNGLATVLGVAWIPALLALVFPMAELPRSDRFPIIIVLLVAVAAFDIGSYFVGRALGSRKLSPVLSPNKTVEGLIGGVIATLIIALFSAAVVEVFDVGAALAMAAGVIVASPLGDLAESLVKRSLGIKDMGQLIPGHGGVLDRIDSYLFAVPVAYVVLRWTGLL